MNTNTQGRDRDHENFFRGVLIAMIIAPFLWFAILIPIWWWMR